MSMFSSAFNLYVETVIEIFSSFESKKSMLN